MSDCCGRKKNVLLYACSGGAVISTPCVFNLACNSAISTWPTPIRCFEAIAAALPAAWPSVISVRCRRTAPEAMWEKPAARLAIIKFCMPLGSRHR